MKIKENKNKKAISLIVLVVTILVLAILAATVIITISNTNVINQANQTTFKSDMVSYKEAYELYITNKLAEDISFDRSTLNLIYNDANADTFKEIFGEVSEKYQDGLQIQLGKLIYETDDETEKGIAKDLGMEKLEYIGTETTADGKSAYIGCYVDADGDGTVDSVIFADLAHDASGTWNPWENTGTYATTGGAWGYSKESDLKMYVETGETYEGKFGTNPVLEVVEGSTGSDRFYCMALNNITSTETTNNYFTWYYKAYYNSGYISDYADVTKVGFGEGRANTKTMIEKWNGTKYGAQNGSSGYLDVWGVIQDKVNKGWFLPSANEWAAFGSAFDITTSNYSSTYGLNNYYWSSSLCSANIAYYTTFGSGCMYGGTVNSYFYVRLAATF